MNTVEFGIGIYVYHRLYLTGGRIILTKSLRFPHNDGVWSIVIEGKARSSALLYV